jgi:predicted phage tail protein
LTPALALRWRRAGIGARQRGLFAGSAVGRCVAGWAGVATVAASSFGRAVVVPAGAAVLLSGVASVLAVLLPPALV